MACVIAFHRLYPGLLEHDLRNPDVVGILVLPPGQIPVMTFIPREKHTRKLRIYLLIIHGMSPLSKFHLFYNKVDFDVKKDTFSFFENFFIFFKKVLAFSKYLCYYMQALERVQYALVAQLDRVTDYESVGRGFESLPAYQKSRYPLGCLLFCLYEDGTRTHLHASVRWTLAETSANTGFYIYFSFSLRERKMYIESLPAYQKSRYPLGCLLFCLYVSISLKSVLQITARTFFIICS